MPLAETQEAPKHRPVKRPFTSLHRGDPDYEIQFKAGTLRVFIWLFPLVPFG